MIALFLVVHIFVGATTAGGAVALALILGFDSLLPLLAAAALGTLVSIPLSWIVAKRIGG